MGLTWKKLAYEADVILNSVLTAEGDIIYASSANTPAALAHGSEGDVLTLASGIPSWAAPGAPGAHATSHKDANADHIHLNEFGLPTAAVPFAGYEATNLVLHTAAVPPTTYTAVLGQIYFDTDLSAYICTEIAS